MALHVCGAWDARRVRDRGGIVNAFFDPILSYLSPGSDRCAWAFFVARVVMPLYRVDAKFRAATYGGAAMQVFGGLWPRLLGRCFGHRGCLNLTQSRCGCRWVGRPAPWRGLWAKTAWWGMFGSSSAGLMLWPAVIFACLVRWGRFIGRFWRGRSGSGQDDFLRGVAFARVIVGDSARCLRLRTAGGSWTPKASVDVDLSVLAALFAWSVSFQRRVFSDRSAAFQQCGPLVDGSQLGRQHAGVCPYGLGRQACLCSARPACALCDVSAARWRVLLGTLAWLLRSDDRGEGRHANAPKARGLCPRRARFDVATAPARSAGRLSVHQRGSARGKRLVARGLFRAARCAFRIGRCSQPRVVFQEPLQLRRHPGISRRNPWTHIQV